MAKKNSPQSRRDTPTAAPQASPEAAPPNSFVVFRETVESIVVAFVLAFLFRTFEAEAFVIPTGSMSPSLQGRHKDVECAECGYRFRTSASSEDLEDIGPGHAYATPRDAEVVGGVCPMCSFPMPFTDDLPEHVRDEVAELTDLEQLGTFRTYPGDRILVNKYGFDFGDPERWDVIVFKFPGDGNMNYIKRCVGLPGEELKIYQGDIFTHPLAGDQHEFRLERKPADKVAAMLQTVHDTDYESAKLYNAGWPLRWAATTRDGWTEDPVPGEKTVAQRFTVDLPADAPEAWLRYRHMVAEETDDWIAAELAAREPATRAEAQQVMKAKAHPQLISDFNSYNATLTRRELSAYSWRYLQTDFVLGMNWVGDLAVDADVDVLEARGDLSLDLVEAGRHFRATIDLQSGQARLAIIDGRDGKPVEGFAAEAATSVKAPGKYHLRFANVDDQLLLWVNDELVPFEDSTYDPDALFPGGRKGMIPWANAGGGDQGDLAPVGVGARGAKLEITRLAVLRDVYYIATDAKLVQNSPSALHLDYSDWRTSVQTEDGVARALSSPHELFARPDAWNRFLTRREMPFKVEEGQLFAMGDNSPFSSDCRLWTSNPPYKGKPGGPYLPRDLLIGKAICVFWPHSWGAIPGLPMLPGFPNFGDMRLVR